MFELDVDDVPLPTLESEICAWAGRIAACTCAWLLGVAAFDRRHGWTGAGIRSCAHWLSWVRHEVALYELVDRNGGSIIFDG